MRYVGDQIRKRRKDLGYPQSRVAKDAEISIPYLSGIENGKRTPSLLIATNISTVLGITLEEMTGHDICPGEAVRVILRHIGEDPWREGLKETPRRFLEYLEEATKGSRYPDWDMTTFEKENYDQMIVQSNIPFYSLCEHHLAPIFGTVAIGYIPEGRIVGLSKLSRVAGEVSRGLQNQERITSSILEWISNELAPQGVIVVVKARHFCMEMRGVRVHDVWTTTSALTGEFEKPEVRAEFFKLADI